MQLVPPRSNFFSESMLNTVSMLSPVFAARKKANQDSYYCETHFTGDDQKAFFAVFDGHGQFGDICSQFSAEYVRIQKKCCDSGSLG